MPKIKIIALVLDYGRVLSLPQDSRCVNNILEMLNQDYSDFHEAYIADRDEYDRGQVSGEGYWGRVLKRLGLPRDESGIKRLLKEDVKSWTKVNEEMIAFITENRGKFKKLAIISNMTVDTLSFLRKNCSWLSLFDDLTFSCEIGVNKPDRAIYESCLRELAIAPDECLFVDDSAENVRGAVEAGMNAVQFTSQIEFMHELNKKYDF